MHYVLTESVNDYDQHGEYYTASWSDKPTVEQLMDCPKVGTSGLSRDSAKTLLDIGKYSPTPSDSLWSIFTLYEIK